jgi:hypothetical protein
MATARSNDSSTIAFSVPARGWVKPLAFRRSLQEARSAGEQGPSANLADAVDRESESEGPVLDGGGAAPLRLAERADIADFSRPARSRTPRLQARVGRSDPATYTPRVARDKAPVAPSPSHVFAPGTVAAAYARRRESPARARPFVDEPHASAVAADTSGNRPFASPAPNSQPENTLGTRCTVLNNHAASTDLPLASVLLAPLPWPLTALRVSPGTGQFR